MFNFVFNFFLGGKKQDVVETTQTWMDRELSVTQSHYARIKSAIYSKDDEVEKLVKRILEEGEWVGHERYYIHVKMDNKIYKIWCSQSTPEGFASTIKIEGIGTLFNNSRPSIETINRLIDFANYHRSKEENIKKMRLKITPYSWNTIVDYYIKLAENNHYSKFTIASYAKEIFDFLENSRGVLSEKEIQQHLNKHLEILLDIAKKAKLELDTQLFEIARKEAMEMDIKKEILKKAVKESSDLMETKYRDYTKDFGLENEL